MRPTEQHERRPRPPPRLPPPPWLAPPAATISAQPVYPRVPVQGWRPRGPPPLPCVPPHPRVIARPRPPWPRGPPPHFGFARPPQFHQPHALFPRAPRALAPMDPDAAWLSSFEKTHAGDTGEKQSPSTGKPSEPPLRRLRRHVTEISTTLAELESNAHRLIELERKLSETEVLQEEEGVIGRLRIEAERKRTVCSELRAKLEGLCHPPPLGLGPERSRDIIAFAKRIKKKKLYRIRRKEKLHAERMIHNALATETPSEQTQTTSAVGVASLSTDKSVAAVGSPDSKVTSQAEQLPTKRRIDERNAAERVLLLLQLRELRRGNSMTNEERERAETMRDQTMACLQNKKTRKRLQRRAKHISSNESHSQTASAQASAESAVRVVPLRDPYAVDMETLIDVRRKWDYFLTPPTVNGATSIPPHFVIPPANPSPEWSSFLEQDQVHN